MAQRYPCFPSVSGNYETHIEMQSPLSQALLHQEAIDQAPDGLSETNTDATSGLQPPSTPMEVDTADRPVGDVSSTLLGLSSQFSCRLYDWMLGKTSKAMVKGRLWPSVLLQQGGASSAYSRGSLDPESRFMIQSRGKRTSCYAGFKTSVMVRLDRPLANCKSHNPRECLPHSSLTLIRITNKSVSSPSTTV